MALSDEATPTLLLTEYYAAFSTLEVEAALPFFHEPSMIIGPQGVFAASKRAVLAGVFGPTMEDLRTKQYGRSELNVRHMHTLSPTATLVIGVAVRYRQDGEEMERVGVTYVLHMTGAGWKIAVFIVHEPVG